MPKPPSSLRTRRHLIRGLGCAAVALSCAADSEVVFEEHSLPEAVSATGGISGILIQCGGDPLESTQITVAGSGLGALTNNEGAFLVLGVPAGPQVLRAQAIGYTGGTMPVTVVSGLVTDLGRITFGCDRVSMDRTAWTGPAGPPIESVLVLDGEDDTGACVDDLLMGDGAFEQAFFPMVPNLVPVSAACRNEVTVLSTGHAPHLDTSPASWTTGQDDVYASAMPGRLAVQVNVWLAVPASDTLEVIDLVAEHLAAAQEAFELSRAGISLDGIVATAVGGMATIDDDCAGAIGNGVQTSAWYDSGRVNVYYVPQAYLSSGTTARGVSCTDDTNMIFVTESTPSATTLAHELGHAFGLRRKRGHSDLTLTVEQGGPLCPSASDDQDPAKAKCQPPCPADWGPDLRATPGCQRFAATNVMDPVASLRIAFTAGQVYQMSFLLDSRLNLNGYRSGTTKSTCGTLPSDSVPCPFTWIDP